MHPTHRILLVDDTSVIREVFSLVLERGGYEVETATDGQQGLDLIRNNPPEHFSLIVTDFLMPNMGGVTMAIEARKYYMQFAMNPPIVLSTSAETGSLPPNVEKVVDLILHKPVSVLAFLDEINILIENKYPRPINDCP